MRIRRKRYKAERINKLPISASGNVFALKLGVQYAALLYWIRHGIYVMQDSGWKLVTLKASPNTMGAKKFPGYIIDREDMKDFLFATGKLRPMKY